MNTEALIRLSVFITAFASLALIETLLPKQTRIQTRQQRWPTNLALAAINTLLLRTILPVLAIGAAVIAADRQWGLLHYLNLPSWMEFILAVLILDLLTYAAHLAFHHIPFLWNFHKIHHTDRDIDVSTALRFHPMEILLSMLFKTGCAIMLGATPEAILFFEILLNSSAMFNHANIKLNKQTDQRLRYLIVTPDMHRVHHSTIKNNSNFGFCLSLWDKIFKTCHYATEHDAMTTGLEEHLNDPTSSLFWTISLPFQRPKPTTTKRP